ncbi:hypothetical protein GCM10022255_083460 [Dactylosporangium darangshiense]|uniref:Serine/threonine protein phosphatase n=2 Tax=Dactylosporangium darangshiense TaxID=579108 RepID=A0ABP8DMB2_9ACTN
MIDARRDRHDRASGWLAARSDDELAAMMAAAPAGPVGVGGDSAVIDAGGVPVFAKRVPITQRELDRPHSTADLYGLPAYCQYGIGGPGFGAWRELAANLVVTEGVLAGEAASFPLLYHWRVLPGRAPIADEHRDIDAAVARLGGDAAVRTRLVELAAARSSLVLFGEYLPHDLAARLAEDPVGQAERAEHQMFEVVGFLRRRELLHMDGHLGNLRADGERLYLTDFGLATSPRFELSAAERAFAVHHMEHDAGYAAMQLVNWLVTAVCGAPTSPAERNAFVRRCAGGGVPPGVPPHIAAILARHAPAAARMNDFYWQLFGGDVHARWSGL